jgi:RimJ/RimL family protein N-acetyltransferase
MMTLETERLLLRPLRQTDLEAYAAMCADPEVMRYLSDRAVLNREDAGRQLAMLVGPLVVARLWELGG